MPLSGPGVGTAHRSCHSFGKRICDARNCLIRVCENELQRTVPCTRGDYCRLSRLVLRAICVGRGLTLTLMASAVYACPILPHAMEQSLCKSWPACGRFWRGTIISRAVTFRSLCSRSVSRAPASLGSPFTSAPRLPCPAGLFDQTISIGHLWHRRPGWHAPSVRLESLPMVPVLSDGSTIDD